MWGLRPSSTRVGGMGGEGGDNAEPGAHVEMGVTLGVEQLMLQAP